MRRPRPLPNIAILTASAMLIPGAARADCQPPADGPPMCLVGTITSPGYVAALIELAGNHGLETVMPNGRLLDWRVLKIAPRAVLLGQNEQEVRLSLDDRDAAQANSGDTPAAGEPSESIAARSMRLRLTRREARQKP